MNESEQPDSTAVGSGYFNTTHWSVVLLAGKSSSPQRSAALEKLCRAYWQPLYFFARRKGHAEEDAKDFTQQFFARLLERNDFESVDPDKGKFRTFLLTSFSHFLSNELDRARAAKRGGGQKILSFDELQPDRLDEIGQAAELSPDALFDLRWAMTVMETALTGLRKELSSSGKAAQFEGLKRFLTEDAGEGEYAAVAQQLSMTPSSVAVTVHRLRSRYREFVRAEVAQTVRNPLELDQEMRHLCEVLSRR